MHGGLITFLPSLCTFFSPPARLIKESLIKLRLFKFPQLQWWVVIRIMTLHGTCRQYSISPLCLYMSFLPDAALSSPCLPPRLYGRNYLKNKGEGRSTPKYLTGNDIPEGCNDRTCSNDQKDRKNRTRCNKNEIKAFSLSHYFVSLLSMIHERPEVPCSL